MSDCYYFQRLFLENQIVVIASSLRHQPSFIMKMVAARLFQGYRWTSCLTPKSFSTVNILPHVALNKTAFTTTMMVTKMKMTSFRFDRTLPSAYYYIKGGRDSRTVATLVPHSAFSPSCSNSPSVSSLDWTKKLGMDSLLVVQALCPKLLTNFSLKQYANELYDHVKRMSEPPKNPFIRPKRDKEEDEESEGADKVSEYVFTGTQNHLSGRNRYLDTPIPRLLVVRLFVF